MSREQTYTCDGCGKTARWANGAERWSKVEVTRRTRYRNDEHDACSEACVKAILARLAGLSMDRESLIAETEAVAQQQTKEARENADRQIEQARKDAEQARANAAQTSRDHAAALNEVARLRDELDREQRFTRRDLVDALREAMRPLPTNAADPDQVAIVFEKGLTEIIDRKLRAMNSDAAPEAPR